MAGPPPPIPDEANVWLRDRFAEYYHRHPPTVPDRFGRREYAFVFFGGKGMLRHLSFRTKAEFEEFHARRGPAHSYYSTAFYTHPDAPTMQEKGWLGAELIFDLDADHVPGSQNLPYPQQLAKVKEHFIRLLDEFVLGDFGFDEKDLVLTFSGGRGYHCHVLAERALELTSAERREIVDYITGTGLDPERFGLLKVIHAQQKTTFGKPQYSFRIPPEGSPGWGNRINRAVQTFVETWRARPFEEFREKYRGAEFEGVNGKKVRFGATRLEKLFDQIQRTTADRIREGYFDMGSEMQYFSPHVVAFETIALEKGETDEPVTADVKRVIRTPGTLHGKSGLKVVPLRRDQIEGFDPLRDAVAFGDEPTGIRVIRAGKLGMKGQLITLEEGTARVPEWAAVFAVMRGWALPLA